MNPLMTKKELLSFRLLIEEMEYIGSLATLPVDPENSNDDFKKFVMECGCQGNCQGCGSGCAGACWNQTSG